MEIALDFAINCSPDHPYVAEHPEWFYKRPDGTIKYAENPPKKYEDIYPLNFRCANWQELWEEMKSIILFWAEHGVRIFRVDNPHTKPVAFWEFLIRGVREKFPDTIFLSEAFTRPKMMKALAKAGFTQSYTYFTWRTSKSGADRVFHRTHPDGDARIFSRQSLHQHARYFAVPPANRRAVRCFRFAPCSQPRCRAFTASTAASSFAKTPRSPAARSISIRRNISLRSAIGMRREISRR